MFKEIRSYIYTRVQGI